MSGFIGSLFGVPDGAGNNPLQLSFRTDASRKLVCGKVAHGGDFAFHGLSADDNRNYHRIIILAGHRCRALPRVWADGALLSARNFQHGVRTEIREFRDGSRHRFWITWYDGRPNTPADPHLISENIRPQPLRHTDTYDGLCYAVITARYDDDSLTSIPDLTFELEGGFFYDRRLDSTAGGSGGHRRNQPNTWNYTTNPAVILDHYQLGIVGGENNDKTIFGMELLPWQVPYDDFEESANICDEIVLGQPRYAANGILSAEDDHRNNVNKLSQSMAAIPYDVGGRLAIRPAQARPVVMTIYDGDLVDSEATTLSTTPSGSDLVNVVRGNYKDPSSRYNTVDYPPLRDEVLISSDGREFEHTLNLEMETNLTRAQRLSKIELMRQTLRDRISETYMPRANELEVGDWFRRVSNLHGTSDKVFEVEVLRRSDDLTVYVEARETNSSVVAFSQNEVISVPTPDPIPPVSRGFSIIPDVTATPSSREGGGASVPSVQLDFNFDGDGENVDFFEIQIGISDGGTPPAIIDGGESILRFENVEGLTFNIPNLMPSTSYAYRVRTITGRITGEWGAFQEFLTTSDFTSTNSISLGGMTATAIAALIQSNTDGVTSLTATYGSTASAAASAAAALASQSAAAVSETASQAAQTAAETAQSLAEQAENNASSSATASANSASAAGASETAAGQSAAAAQTSQQSAATSAGEASASETAAAQSATSAQGSENSAAQSATLAANSEGAAATSAAASATSAGEASASETAAAQSATASQGFSQSAETASSNAQGSATAAAAQSATSTAASNAAAQSATSAQNSENAAQTSAGQASVSAGQAALSEANAQGSAVAAASSQTLTAEIQDEVEGLATSLHPSTFEADGTHWTSNNQLSPLVVGPSHPNVTYPLAGQSKVANCSNYLWLLQKGVHEITPNTAWEVTITLSKSQGSGPTRFYHLIYGLDEDYLLQNNVEGYVRNFSKFVSPSDGEVTLTFAFTSDPSLASACTARNVAAGNSVHEPYKAGWATKKWFRIGGLPNFDTRTTSDHCQIRSMSVRNITGEILSEQSAAASATSASQASASETAAGSFASAANTSATSAATSQANAAASASQSSVSAGSSAASATTSANHANSAVGSATAAFNSAAQSSANALESQTILETTASLAAGQSWAVNPAFGEWGASVLPAKWETYNNGIGGGSWSRETSITKFGNASRHSTGGGNDLFGMFARTYGQEGLTPNITLERYIVFEAWVYLVSGGWEGSGFYLNYRYSAAQSYSTRIVSFAPKNLPTGKWVKVSEFVDWGPLPSGLTEALFYAMTNFPYPEGRVAKDIIWGSASVRPATPSEIEAGKVSSLEASVTQTQTAIATVEGALSASLGLGVKAGTAGAQLELIALQDGNTSGSLARISAQDIVLNGSVTANSLSTNSVTASKIAANAVTANKIAANAVTANKIAANAITADKINVNNLSAISANLGTISVGTANIANGAITSAKIGNLAVDTLQVADGAISAVSTITGSGSTTGAAVTIGSSSITSSGNEILIAVSFIGSGGVFSGSNSDGNVFTRHFNVQLWRGTTLIRTFRHALIGIGGEGVIKDDSSFIEVDQPPAGTYTYHFKIPASAGGGGSGNNISISELVMRIQELKK